MAEATCKQRIQRAIDYIERNLTNDVSLGSAAAAACWSPYHFMRTFHAITGCTVAEYVRERRMDLAAYRLVFGGERILDVAMDVGYETQEAFTRAFKRSYGSSPGRYRAVGAYRMRRARLEVVRRLELFRADKRGGREMEPTIKQIGPLHIMGAELRTNGDGSNREQIPQFWQRFLTERTFERIPGTTRSGVSYGLCTKMDEETGDFSYVIGTEVSESAAPPAGLSVFDVAAATYAVFTARGRVAEGEYTQAIQQAWGYAYGEWFPNSTEWERAEGDDFELYDDSRMNADVAECDICIPVEKKQ